MRMLLPFLCRKDSRRRAAGTHAEEEQKGIFYADTTVT